MEALRVLVDHPWAPPVFFTVVAALFLAAVRSPWPWTRTGGAILAAATGALAAAVLLDPLARARIAAPERLPVALVVLASGAGLWLGLHQAQQEPGSDETSGGFAPVELLAGGLAVLGVAVLAFAVGAPLAGPAAVEARMTAAASAPWFLLGLAEIGRYFDPWVAWIYLPVLLLAALAGLPFLGAFPPAREETEPRGPDFTERREVVYLVVAVVFLLILLPMASGAFLHADGVQADLFAAGQPETELATLRPLSQRLWGLVAERPPRWAWLRELPVLLLGLAYFVVPPLLLPRWRPTQAVFGRYLKSLGRRRFTVAMTLVLALALVPLKIYSWWLLAIGYFLYLPELGLNF